MKRALLVTMISNYSELGDRDCLAAGLHTAGYRVDAVPFRKAHTRIPVEDYDLVALWGCTNSLYLARPGAKTILKHLIDRARPEALALIVCDTSYPLDPVMWNTDEGTFSKEPVYTRRPFKVLGSFHDDVLHSGPAMERVTKMWMNRLHPESTFHPIEWLAFNIHRLSALTRDGAHVPEAGSLHAFYYGLNKPPLIPSLKRLGLGDHPRDAVYGKIAQAFPTIRNLTDGTNQWQPYVRAAERNLFPYDPVKSDYQLTRRLLEILALAGPDTVTFDDRVSEYIRAATSLDVWDRAAAEASRRLATLF